MPRRSHYELAFERYLDLRGTPYVAIEDVRHHLKGSTAAKAFDYIVYPADGPACLVDVKGRKTPRLTLDGDCRVKNWVTRRDVQDLLEWEDVFGEGFAGWFAFGYWIAGEKGGKATQETASFLFAGRRYRFWLAPVRQYARYQRRLSKSWDTVSIPREQFTRISRRLEECWAPSPC